MSSIIFWVEKSWENYQERDPKVTKRDFWITVVVSFSGKKAPGFNFNSFFFMSDSTTLSPIWGTFGLYNDSSFYYLRIPVHQFRRKGR